MNNEIQILERKTLKLKNILMTPIQDKSLNNVKAAIENIQKFIKHNNTISIGPLITYSKTLYDVNKKNVITENFLLFQTQKKIVVTDNYRFKDILIVENCLLAKYEGLDVNSHLAYSKLQVHAFEKKIELLDEVYTVFIKQSNEIVKFDMFIKCIGGI